MTAGQRVIELRDVGPRDGLQREEPVPVEARVALANGLAARRLA